MVFISSQTSVITAFTHTSHHLIRTPSSDHSATSSSLSPSILRLRDRRPHHGPRKAIVVPCWVLPAPRYPARSTSKPKDTGTPSCEPKVPWNFSFQQQPQSKERLLPYHCEHRSLRRPRFQYLFVFRREHFSCRFFLKE